MTLPGFPWSFVLIIALVRGWRLLAQIPPAAFSWLPQLGGTVLAGLVSVVLWRYVDALSAANERRHKGCEARLTALAADNRKLREDVGELRTDHAVATSTLQERVGHLEQNAFNPFTAPSRPPKVAGE